MPTPITVFVVDSDESMRRAMRRLLKVSGFRPVCVSSVEALFREDLISNESVLLIDVRTERQFTQSLNEQLHIRGLTLPVIYLTDCDTDHMRREARRVGAVGYFRKPVDEHALSDAITFAVLRKPDHELKRTFDRT